MSQLGSEKLDAPPADLREALLRHDTELSVLPAVATEAIQLLENPDCSVGEFATVVERDLRIATDVLALANSALFAHRSPVTALHQAVFRLGFEPCKHLILTSSLKSLMERITPAEEGVRQILWRHGFATAVACLHLNRALNLRFNGEEFSGGLFHDLGRTLLVAAAGKSHGWADPLDFNDDHSCLERERAALGTDHCEFGAWFLERHQIPEQLVEIVRYHHTPGDGPTNRRLVALVAAADDVANHLERDGRPDTYDPHGNPGIQALAAAGDPSAPQQFMDCCAVILEKTSRDVQQLLQPL